MNAIEYLREKGILGEGKTKWMVTFLNNPKLGEVNIIDIMERYADNKELQGKLILVDMNEQIEYLTNSMTKVLKRMDKVEEMSERLNHNQDELFNATSQLCDGSGINLRQRVTLIGTGTLPNTFGKISDFQEIIKPNDGEVLDMSHHEIKDGSILVAANNLSTPDYEWILTAEKEYPVFRMDDEMQAVIINDEGKELMVSEKLLKRCFKPYDGRMKENSSSKIANPLGIRELSKKFSALDVNLIKPTDEQPGKVSFEFPELDVEQINNFITAALK